MVDSVVELVRGELSTLKIPETIEEEFIYELDSAETNIVDWKKHLLRTIHQDFAKKNILHNLTSNQALIISSCHSNSVRQKVTFSENGEFHGMCHV